MWRVCTRPTRRFASITASAVNFPLQSTPKLLKSSIPSATFIERWQRRFQPGLKWLAVLRALPHLAIQAGEDGPDAVHRFPGGGEPEIGAASDIAQPFELPAGGDLRREVRGDTQQPGRKVRPPLRVAVPVHASQRIVGPDEG